MNAAAPELTGKTWINTSKGQAIRLADLRGKIVGSMREILSQRRTGSSSVHEALCILETSHVSFPFAFFCAVFQAAAAGQGLIGTQLTITFEDALARAKLNAVQLLSANIATQLAREDTVRPRPRCCRRPTLQPVHLHTAQWRAIGSVHIERRTAHL